MASRQVNIGCAGLGSKLVSRFACTLFISVGSYVDLGIEILLFLQPTPVANRSGDLKHFVLRYHRIYTDL
jgi:hypothetical protein